MELKRVSIVIPTRLRERELARCLERLADQVDGAAAEVLVSDDAASETTRQMVESRFSFARWGAGPGRGPAANRNAGAARATGEFILFLDDDVVPSTTLLSRYLAAVRPDVHIYEGRTTCDAGVRSPLEHAPINQDGGRLWSCNMMVRRDRWLSIGGFDEEFPYAHLEDVAFRERLKSSGDKIVFVPEAVVDHPPRRRPPAHVSARQQESSFVFHYKYLHERPKLGAFCGRFINQRLRSILQFSPSWDSAVAFGSIWVEMFHILKQWPAWDRKWRRRFGD